jgi:hypothetical protein
MTKKRLKQIRNWVISIGLDVGIVGGYLYTQGESAIYGNFLTLMHIIFWICVPLHLLGAGLFTFMGVLIDKVNEGNALSAATNQNQLDKFKDMTGTLRETKLKTHNWWFKLYKGVCEPGVILFIALVMGHWSLFTAYVFSYLTSLWILGSAKSTYDKLPMAWKEGEDKDGNGIPDDEEKAIEEAGKDPITKAIDQRREARAAAEREKTEATENLVDAMLEGDG